MPARRIGSRLITRTTLLLFMVGAVLLAAGVYGAWRVHRLHKRGTDMLSENVAGIRAAEQLQGTASEIRHRLKRHLSSGNDRQLEDVDELISDGRSVVEELESLATSSQEEAIVGRTRDSYDRLNARFASLATEPSAIVRRQTILSLADDLIPDRLIAEVDNYIEINEAAIDRSTTRNQTTANRLMFGLLLLGTCGGVAGLIAGYVIARLVNRTIVQLAIPIRDTAGTLSQVAGPVTWTTEPGIDDLQSVLRSVSDHVRSVVERLQESERDRLRAEQFAAVGQLAAGLAHEIRNPLTSMKAILQLVPEPSQFTPRDLEVLREETSRLEHTVQSLLDFARPPAPNKTTTHLGDLLDQTVSLVERRCERKGLLLEHTPPPADLTLLADGAQLRQVVLNLLINAIEVTPRGGTIRLECEEHDSPAVQPRRLPRLGNRNGNPSESLAPEEGWVTVRVSDTGPGLPREIESRLFEPFVTTKETGTGLGLSICRRVVECHGGTLSARTRDGGGAMFEVRLPSDAPAGSPAVSSHAANAAAR